MEARDSRRGKVTTFDPERIRSGEITTTVIEKEQLRYISDFRERDCTVSVIKEGNLMPFLVADDSGLHIEEHLVPEGSVGIVVQGPSRTNGRTQFRPDAQISETGPSSEKI